MVWQGVFIIYVKIHCTLETPRQIYLWCFKISFKNMTRVSRLQKSICSAFVLYFWQLRFCKFLKVWIIYLNLQKWNNSRQNRTTAPHEMIRPSWCLEKHLLLLAGILICQQLAQHHTTTGTFFLNPLFMNSKRVGKVVLYVNQRWW